MNGRSDKILPPEMLDYYATGRELDRLTRGIGPLELARTKELVERYLPAPPAVVFDVGGGPGVYACWLARQGYEVHLVDAMPLHIEQARKASAAQPNAPVATLEVGDARQLNWPEGSADAVMLHGPLYHLTERAQRLEAIREAARVLRPGGLLLAFAITSHASTLVGLVNWWVHDPGYFEMCRRELTEGLHLQPPDWPSLFTTAYFHRPGELEAELAEAGLAHEITLAVQGPGWLVPEFEERWQDKGNRETILRLVRLMEADPGALGISPHQMAVARKPGTGPAPEGGVMPLDKSTITFTKARSADAKRLAEASKLAFDYDIHYGAPGPGGPPGYDSAAWQSRAMRFGEYYKIVAGDRIIGGIIVLRKGVRAYEVGRIFIEPEFQDEGIGTKAFEFLWETYPLAKRWTLGTPGWNKRTQHFYKKVGFVEIGTDKVGGILFERLISAGMA